MLGYLEFTRRRSGHPALREFGESDCEGLTPSNKRVLEYYADAGAVNIGFNFVMNDNLSPWERQFLGTRKERAEAWSFAVGVLFRLFDDTSVMIRNYEHEVDAEQPHPFVRHLQLGKFVRYAWRQELENNPFFYSAWPTVTRHLDEVWKILRIPGNRIRDVLAEQPEWQLQMASLLDDVKALSKELRELGLARLSQKLVSDTEF